MEIYKGLAIKCLGHDFYRVYWDLRDHEALHHGHFKKVQDAKDYIDRMPSPDDMLCKNYISRDELHHIREVQKTIFNNAVQAGWYNDLETGNLVKRNFAEQLCLVHSELSEALEGYRKDLQDDHLPDRSMVEVELADAMIRIFDLAGSFDLDLAGAIRDKVAYNLERADHKIENRKKDGGKKI